MASAGQSPNLIKLLFFGEEEIPETALHAQRGVHVYVSPQTEGEAPRK